jgi:hypothetical protein
MGFEPLKNSLLEGRSPDSTELGLSLSNLNRELG